MLIFRSRLVASKLAWIYNGSGISSMQVSKWGNSLAVRLPAVVVEALDLKEGDEIEISIAGKRDFKVARDRSKERALEQLRQMESGPSLLISNSIAKRSMNTISGSLIPTSSYTPSAKTLTRAVKWPKLCWPREGHYQFRYLMSSSLWCGASLTRAGRKFAAPST